MILSFNNASNGKEDDFSEDSLKIFTFFVFGGLLFTTRCSIMLVVHSSIAMKWRCPYVPRNRQQQRNQIYPHL